jgi:hypothetical protein
MRYLVYGLLVLGAASCDTNTVCCETTEGFFSVIEGTCGGRVVDVSRCAENVVDTGTAPQFDCQGFCQRILVACPQTTQCLETCQLAPFAPGPAATRCAQDAIDCAGAATCWDLITGTPL